MPSIKSVCNHNATAALGVEPIVSSENFISHLELCIALREGYFETDLTVGVFIIVLYFRKGK